jgi:hypothetical protein
MSAMTWGDPIRIFHRKAAKVAQKRQGDRGTVSNPAAVLCITEIFLRDPWRPLRI